MQIVAKPLIFLAAALLMASCSENPSVANDPPRMSESKQTPAAEKPKKAAENPVKAEIVMVESKGVGPISHLELEEKIDADMAAAGKKTFNNLCAACHKMDKRLVGPPMADITKRRTPEWIMNMILAPDRMVKEDPTAIALLDEYKAPMANQNVSEQDARALLEYFRKYDAEN